MTFTDRFGKPPTAIGAAAGDAHIGDPHGSADAHLPAIIPPQLPPPDGGPRGNH